MQPASLFKEAKLVFGQKNSWEPLHYWVDPLKHQPGISWSWVNIHWGYHICLCESTFDACPSNNRIFPSIKTSLLNSSAPRCSTWPKTTWLSWNCYSSWTSDHLAPWFFQLTEIHLGWNCYSSRTSAISCQARKALNWTGHVRKQNWNISWGKGNIQRFLSTNIYWKNKI